MPSALFACMYAWQCCWRKVHCWTTLAARVSCRLSLICNFEKRGEVWLGGCVRAASAGESHGRLLLHGAGIPVCGRRWPALALHAVQGMSLTTPSEWLRLHCCSVHWSTWAFKPGHSRPHLQVWLTPCQHEVLFLDFLFSALSASACLGWILFPPLSSVQLHGSSEGRCLSAGSVWAPAGFPAAVGLYLWRDARGSTGRVRSRHRTCTRVHRLLHVRCPVIPMFWALQTHFPEWWKWLLLLFTMHVFAWMLAWSCQWHHRGRISGLALAWGEATACHSQPMQRVDVEQAPLHVQEKTVVLTWDFQRC